MNFFIKLFLFSLCIQKVFSNDEDTSKKNGNPEFSETRIKKSINNNMNLRWTFPIDYYVDYNVNRSTVKKALEILHKETCIRFRETFTFKNGGLKYVNGSGCVSFVGKVSNSIPQDISLGKDCNFVTTVLHETSHALGVIHEMSRHDRDRYIDVKFQNIYPHVLKNFESSNLVKANPLGTKYDFGSVMHYDRLAGSYNGLLAMDPKYKNYLKTIGQSTRFGFNDAKQLNIYYCNNKCIKKLQCKMGGYTNPNNCNICKCPNFYTGKLCDKLMPSSKTCGNTKFKTKTTYKLIILNGIKNCYFQITAPRERKIEMTIIETNLHDNFVCQPGQGLEVKFFADKTVSGAVFCGRNMGKLIKSENNIITMQYVGLSPYSSVKIKYREV